MTAKTTAERQREYQKRRREREARMEAALKSITETRWDMGAADACVVAMKQIARDALA